MPSGRPIRWWVTAVQPRAVMRGRSAARQAGPESRVVSIRGLSGTAAALPSGSASLRGWGPASLVAHPLPEQRARDGEPLDLARALVDLRDLGVAVVALGGELLGVAVAAEHLDRLAGPVARHPAPQGGA